MLELRNSWSYFKNPGEAPPLKRRQWNRSYLCLGGLRLGIINRAGGCAFGVRCTWRWSWRGVQIDAGPIRLYAGWMAPQFRADN
jgi:hypothetical protein